MSQVQLLSAQPLRPLRSIFSGTVLALYRTIYVQGNIQPACEAGEESASPRRWRSRAWGNRTQTHPSPRSGRQMKRAKIARLGSVASFAGSPTMVAVTPGSASPSPGASTLAASCAGWLKGFFQPIIGCGHIAKPR